MTTTTISERPMNVKDDEQLVAQIGRGGDEAGQLFRQMLGGTDDERENVRALVQRHPQTALALLASGSDLGLTIKGQGDVFDTVIGEVKDPEEARRLMHDHFTHERLIELIKARGDLPSAASDVVEADDIVAAMLADAGIESKGADGFDNPEAVFLLRSWLMKIKDREDYEAILTREIGSFTLRQHALVACWYAIVRDPEEADDDDRSDFESAMGLMDELGIDAAEGREELIRLLNNERIPEFSSDEIESARRNIAARRAKLERAPTVADQARKDASKLDF